MKKYLLSICIPTFNRKNSLKKMLDSINPNPHVEVVICDDGSNDNTSELIPLYKNKLNINYIYQKNYGVSSAILNAYNISKGEYVIKMDSDDLFTKDGLEFILKTLNKNLEKEAFLFGVYAVKNKIHSKNIPPDGKVNFISVRADFKVKGDLKEVVKKEIVLKNMYRVPTKIKRIPPGLLWYRIAQKFNCLSFSKVVAIKNYSESGITSNMHYLKISYPEPMIELYELLSKSNVYKSILFRWRSRLLWSRYSFHNSSMKLKKWWHWFVFIPGWFIYNTDKIILLMKRLNK